jgi:hypothetical protein
MSDYTNLLRALADLIEEHDLTPAQSVSDSEVTVHANGKDAAKNLAAWRRALGGTWEKNDYSTFITMDQKTTKLPGAPTVELFIDKDRCTSRVVGTETVVIPAVEAAPSRVEEKPIIEWDCGESLLEALVK